MTKSRAEKFRAHGSPEGMTRRTVQSGIKTLDVECPDCGERPGDPCLNAEGSRLSYGFHAPRKRMAIRAANRAGRDVGPAKFIATLSKYRRVQIRHAHGLTQDQLGLFFGVDGQIFQALESGERLVTDEAAVAYGAWLRIWDVLVPNDDDGLHARGRVK